MLKTMRLDAPQLFMLHNHILDAAGVRDNRTPQTRIDEIKIVFKPLRYRDLNEA